MLYVRASGHVHQPSLTFAPTPRTHSPLHFPRLLAPGNRHSAVCSPKVASLTLHTEVRSCPVWLCVWLITLLWMSPGQSLLSAQARAPYCWRPLTAHHVSAAFSLSVHPLVDMQVPSRSWLLSIMLYWAWEYPETSSRFHLLCMSTQEQYFWIRVVLLFFKFLLLFFVLLSFIYVLRTLYTVFHHGCSTLPSLCNLINSSLTL